MREDGARASSVPAALPALAALLLSGAAERAVKGGLGPGRPLPWAMTVDDGVYVDRGAQRDHDLELLLDRKRRARLSRGWRAALGCVRRDADAVWIESRGSVACYRARTGGARPAGAGDGDGELRAPMAAQVVAVAVAAGDRVEPGAALVTLRAMKLEHRVAAPRAALVREVLVREGDQVAFRQVLVRLESGGGDRGRRRPSHGAR